MFLFSFFTFGQSPVRVKQITFSFFKILQKALFFVQKGFKISIQNRKELKSDTETSKTAKPHPDLLKFL